MRRDTINALVGVQPLNIIHMQNTISNASFFKLMKTWTECIDKHKIKTLNSLYIFATIKKKCYGFAVIVFYLKKKPLLIIFTPGLSSQKNFGILISEIKNGFKTQNNNVKKQILIFIFMFIYLRKISSDIGYSYRSRLFHSFLCFRLKFIYMLWPFICAIIIFIFMSYYFF